MDFVEQDWNGTVTSIHDLSEAGFYRPPVKFGLVVGTFAATPYVHLQLEAWRRFYPHCSLLIHDDASHEGEQIRQLCLAYGVDFESNRDRQPHCLGDLTAFLGGLIWARSKGLDILVKVSRRWLFLTDWTASLSELALSSQYPTFCNWTTSFDFGFRTECTGLSVQAWTQPWVLARIADVIARHDHVFVEAFIHGIAQEISANLPPAARRWRETHPEAPDKRGYAVWTLMGSDRCARDPEDRWRWHDCYGAEDYARLAALWQLPHPPASFRDPNGGAGLGLPPRRRRSVRLSILLVTQGSASLARAFESLVGQQFAPGDEVVVISSTGVGAVSTLVAEFRSRVPLRLLSIEGLRDARSNAARNRAMAFVRGDYVVHMSDDAEFVPQAIASIRRRVLKRRKPVYLFRIRDTNGYVLWADQALRPGNVTSAMIVHTAAGRRWGIWAAEPAGDFGFIEKIAQAHNGNVEWCEQVICRVEPDQNAWLPI